MKHKINKNFISSKEEIFSIIKRFHNEGKIFIAGKRNLIKIFDLNGKKVNVKSFKKPNIINKIAYRYFRKSKACRSFEYANLLIEKEIGTPKPIAFLENFDIIGLKDSYYVCEQLDYDLTFRELVKTNFPDAENILRQFTEFSYELHQKGIEFKDHSPGNTLIIKGTNAKYNFFLVDLNRMNFHNSMSFELRMKNLSRLTPKKDMIAIMSNEYAKLSGENEKLIFDTMWKFTEEFQHRFQRKKRLKKKLKFWKKYYFHFLID
jgi:hypothetical protein